MTDKNYPADKDADENYYVIEELLDTQGGGKRWFEVEMEDGDGRCDPLTFFDIKDALEVKAEMERTSPKRSPFRIMHVTTKRRLAPEPKPTILGQVQAVKTELIWIDAQTLAREPDVHKHVHKALFELRKAEAKCE